MSDARPCGRLEEEVLRRGEDENVRNPERVVTRIRLLLRVRRAVAIRSGGGRTAVGRSASLPLAFIMRRIAAHVGAIARLGQDGLSKLREADVVVVASALVLVPAERQAGRVRRARSSAWAQAADTAETPCHRSTRHRNPSKHTVMARPRWSGPRSACGIPPRLAGRGADDVVVPPALSLRVWDSDNVSGKASDSPPSLLPHGSWQALDATKLVGVAQALRDGASEVALVTERIARRRTVGCRDLGGRAGMGMSMGMGMAERRSEPLA